MERRKDSKGRVLKKGESERKDGRYQYRYNDAFGARKTVYANGLNELRDLEKRIEKDIGDGIDYSKGQMTVYELVERYLSLKQGVRYNTRIGYNFVSNILGKEPFSRLKVSNVKVSDAQKWIIKMYNDGKGYSTLSSICGVVKPAFQMACNEDVIRKNPFDFKLSEVLENDTKEKVALTEEQEQALLSFIKTDNVYHKYYDDVLILLKTGLRISELCGLTVADIDFKNEVVIIDHQLLKSKEQGYYIETPKTKSGIRQVPLSRETIQAFQRVMKKRPKAEPFVIDGRSNFLFVNHKGKPKVAIDYNALFVRMVKKYNKHHKDNPLPHITPHTLRHTFCTRLASKNMNPKDLQYIMGHSNISITMNWYAHASIDTAKSEVQRLIA